MNHKRNARPNDRKVGQARPPDLNRAGILKLRRNNSARELDFELEYQLSLTVQERFNMMFRRSREIARTLLKNEYIRPFEIIKRT